MHFSFRFHFLYYLLLCIYLSYILNNPTDETINDDFRTKAQTRISSISNDDNKILKSRLFEDRRVCFLEYLIKEKDNGHDVFRRLNDGKTPLTSSELIRALYMVNASGIPEKDRLEISKEWELMERTLQNEQFWLMFKTIGLNDTPTRVDLLFALVLDVKLGDTKANPLLIFEKLDSPIKKPNGESTDKHFDLIKVWHEVLRCFWWMQSCYDDIEIFNYLCWIANFTDNVATTVYRGWKEHPAICDFKKSLLSKIRKNMNFGEFDKISYDPSNTE